MLPGGGMSGTASGALGGGMSGDVAGAAPMGGSTMGAFSMNGSQLGRGLQQAQQVQQQMQQQRQQQPMVVAQTPAFGQSRPVQRQNQPIGPAMSYASFGAPMNNQFGFGGGYGSV
jgi:hypothetical protein